MKVNIKDFQIGAYAMIQFLKEYEKLNYVENEQIRFDTAKKNFKSNFLNNCSCEICKEKTEQIITLDFYE